MLMGRSCRLVTKTRVIDPLLMAGPDMARAFAFWRGADEDDDANPGERIRFASGGGPRGVSLLVAIKFRSLMGPLVWLLNALEAFTDLLGWVSSPNTTRLLLTNPSPSAPLAKPRATKGTGL